MGSIFTIDVDLTRSASIDYADCQRSTFVYNAVTRAQEEKKIESDVIKSVCQPPRELDKLETFNSTTSSAKKEQTMATLTPPITPITLTPRPSRPLKNLL